MIITYFLFDYFYSYSEIQIDITFPMMIFAKIRVNLGLLSKKMLCFTSKDNLDTFSAPSLPFRENKGVVLLMILIV